ncbi:MAG TPA: S8 family serine peptidase [Pyrinomonadaceae bacterium]|nr:S8 family serine peptidase [Pyrinomonadaceae bacterium]
MSSITNDQIKATGTAQVIAILESAPPPPTGARAAGGMALAAATGSPQLAGLESYFVSQQGQNHELAAAGMSNVAALASTGGTRSRSARSAPDVLTFPNLGVILGTVTREGLQGLRADVRVKKVVGAPQFSLIKPVAASDAKLATQNTWGIEFLKVPKLWAQGLSGKGITVGHLDTGADGKHPALKTAFAGFAEFDSFGVQVMPAPKPHDTGEHGTHTAATIAGRPVSGRSIGVAPKSLLASAIVIEGGNVIARILGGMDWAISQNVRILSMSLGLRGFVDDFLAITQILRSKNVLPVFAVGNEGPATSRSPGNYAECVSIGAHDRNGAVANFSSSQRFVRTDDPLVPDVVAPGVDVISAKPGGGFQSMSGSSMATPHVAGLAALLFEAKPGATAAEVERVIFSSSRLGTIPRSRGNRGIPNAVAALTMLTGTPLGGSAKGTKVKVGGKKSSGKKAAGKKSSAKKTAKKK